MRSYPTASPNCVCQHCGAPFREKPSRLAAGRGRFCSRGCMDANGTHLMKRGPAERFWAMVNTHGPIPEHAPDLGPCWPWAGGDNGNGYGVFWDGKRLTYAHRFALELAGRPLLPGQDGSHLCHNTICARESHLTAEAHRPNVWRSKAAGRIQSGDEHWSRRDSAKVAKGEQRYWNAKLTVEQVAEIRDRYKAGGVTQRTLGDEFGVSSSAVSLIVSGKNWRG